jgi:replicative DNA helicase
MNPRDFAEKALTGSVLREPGRVSDVDTFLETDDFLGEQHRILYDTVRTMVSEAEARVQWDPAPSAPGQQRPLSPAQQALRHTMRMAGDLEGLGTATPINTEIAHETKREIAETVAGYMARYPGLRRRLSDAERVSIDRVLPLAQNENAWQVDGVDPVSVFTRIYENGNLGQAHLESAEGINGPAIHTLMTTAPTQPQVRSYGLMVLEASMRRQVLESGHRIDQVVSTSPELQHVLDMVQTAYDKVGDVQQRWVRATNPLEGWLNQQDPVRTNLGFETMSLGSIEKMAATSESMERIEEDILHHILVRPEDLAVLADRVMPHEFDSADISANFATAVEMHRAGEHVDPVTLAWAQQRKGLDVNPDKLLANYRDGTGTDVGYLSETLLRRSLGRAIRDAAVAANEAARHPGMAPSDVLATARLAYAAVADTARRMQGPRSPGQLAAASSPISLRDALPRAEPAREPPLQPTLSHSASIQSVER